MYHPRHDNSLSYLSLDRIASPQSHRKAYKTAESRFCPHYQKYIHVADVTKQGDAIMNSLNIKCRCEQQKTGLFSDWPGNEVTISDDDF